MTFSNSMSHQFFRFLLFGLINTLLSFLLYLYLLSLMSYFFAYTVSYIVGVLMSYIFNVFFVFNKDVELKNFLRFPAVYAFQYAAAATILWLIQSSFGFSPSIAMIFAIIITAPLTFFANHFSFNKFNTKTSS